MSDIMRHVPFDVPEPFRRFLHGETGPMLRVEEFQDGATMVVRAELPGIDPDRDVDITVSGNTLTIEARREEKSEYRGKHNYRSEFLYGAFARSIQLPQGTREEDIKASYTDGVLEVRIPTPEQDSSPGRKVPVSRSATGAGEGSGGLGTSDTTSEATAPGHSPATPPGTGEPSAPRQSPFDQV
ncbi:MAG: heat-shock protein Hsp20 [Arthrobacter sp.]|jgi:HSP20 family protein|nr:heat-shock protein Hsp20 [Arthrobacter sp.]